NGSYNLDRFVGLIHRHQVTTCFMDSFYLTDLIKAPARVTLGPSLRKILYYRQPLHKNVSKAFKQRFEISDCRFAYCECCMARLDWLLTINSPRSAGGEWTGGDRSAQCESGRRLNFGGAIAADGDGDP